MIRVNQTHDRVLILSVLGDSSVKPLILSDGTSITDDLVDAILDSGLVVAVYDGDVLGGIFCFIEINPATYEIHTNLLPHCRGRKGLEAAREAVFWLFANTMAIRVVTKVPAFNPAARRFAIDAGMRPEYSRGKCYPYGGVMHDVDFLAFGIHDWVWHHANHFSRIGSKFHHEIHAVNDQAGLESHDDDLSHDVMVGAAMSLLMAAASGKGIALYNEWAAVSGYEPVDILSDHPEKTIISMLGLKACIARDGTVSAGG